MTRSRAFVPMLALNRRRLERAAGLAALAALTSFAAPHARAQTVTVTDLSPSGSEGSYAYGASGIVQVGSAYHHDTHGLQFLKALIWKGTAGSAIDFTPPTFDQADVRGISGDFQVGFGYSAPDYNSHALLWHGTAASAVDLSADFTFHQGDNVEAVGVSGNTQVGYTHFIDPDSSVNDNYGAILWHGTADSMTSLNPVSHDPNIFSYQSQAFAVSEDTQVGYIRADNISGPDYEHAVLWHGTADSVVDLNPAGKASSRAYGVSGNTQVGFATGNKSGDTPHAVLWHGTAASYVDLHPAKFFNSTANAAASDVQVGDSLFSSGGINGFENHALLWRGTADSAVDLDAFLPAGLRGHSFANGVTGSNGVYDVVGSAADASNNPHAILWHVVYASPTLTSLIPASRTEGRDAFSLTVVGKNFTKTSAIRWNGQAQQTIYVSPTQLSASIPASLIAHTGTAQITVSTPSLGTSNTRTETINPRPTISSLSPASKKAGDRSFTLTVTGTGFLSKSIIKFNGMPLATSFMSSTTLVAIVPTSLLKTAGTAQITVTTPQVATSSGEPFSITP